MLAALFLGKKTLEMANQQAALTASSAKTDKPWLIAIVSQT